MRYGQYVETKLGRLYIEEEDGVLVYLIGSSSGAKREDDADVIMEKTPLLDLVEEQLREFLSGTRTEFTIPIRMNGTDFQQRVWESLRQIPYGETRTYGQIAAAVGSPKGARAVGLACNRNPIMIIVPCHRVVGADGGLVGFGGGLPMKKALLTVEGRKHE
ncbi:MAG: methylated-DNA--[protein]-cysteine S-methyltransferase [Acetatifactor sp.]|nr:methylated-DNA--[protein]-cysteine S-methyltransferase [Acetatifactor sp.]